MDGRSDGRMDEWTDGRTADGRTDGWTYGRTRRTDGRTNERTAGR